MELISNVFGWDYTVMLVQSRRGDLSSKMLLSTIHGQSQVGKPNPTYNLHPNLHRRSLHHPLGIRRNALRWSFFLRMETWDPDSWPKRKEGRVSEKKRRFLVALYRENTWGKKPGGFFFFSKSFRGWREIFFDYFWGVPNRCWMDLKEKIYGIWRLKYGCYVDGSEIRQTTRDLGWKES